MTQEVPLPVGLSQRISVDPIFSSRSFDPDPKLCFVLMPLSVPRLAIIYQDYVRPAIEGAGLSPLRADEILSNSAVIEDVWKSILSARVIVAELTGHNPNVFYELGIAHTVGREVVPISQQSTTFDIGHIRHILYEDSPESLSQMNQKLRGTLENILRAP
jgi:hypothetical protein